MSDWMEAGQGWLVPKRGEDWFRWGFGTRDAVLRNELASVKQVHGSVVVPVTEVGFAGEGDGLVTRTPGVALGIKTADCLPLLMVDLSRRAVAAVHAGWRGTAQGIAAGALAGMHANFETKPVDVLIAMGPAIGKCCFEVGPEVARQFSGFREDWSEAKEKCHLDLQAINAWQLERAGVLPENIVRNEFCTMCGGDKFWSYRKAGEKAGRMWSVVELEG
jgi:YfiH family protein